MHICSGSWQSRLKPNTKQVFSRGTRRPGCSQHSANPSRKSRCRAAKSTAETGDRPKLEKEEVASVASAKKLFSDLFGEESAGVSLANSLEGLVAENEYEEDDVVNGLLGLANEVQALAKNSQGDDEAVSAQEKLEDQVKAANEKYLRLNADFDNFRKRSAAERDQAGDRIRGEVIKKLVPLVDSFEAAQTSISAETENEKKINGAYQGLYKQMVEAFKALGVEACPGVGQPFDPNFHEAIMREANESVPDGTVLQEFRRGFRLGKTLLRPGMVKVSYSDEPVQPSSGSGSSDTDTGDNAVDIEVKEGM